jgi:hypothetical protein
MKNEAEGSIEPWSKIVEEEPDPNMVVLYRRWPFPKGELFPERTGDTSMQQMLEEDFVAALRQVMKSRGHII